MSKYAKLKERAEHAKKEQLFMGMSADEILALLSEREQLREALMTVCENVGFRRALGNDWDKVRMPLVTGDSK